jgi:hypothetical protein
MHLIRTAEHPGPGPIWAIGGPRLLDAAGVRLVEALTLALLEADCRLAVGCATGADAAVLQAAEQAGRAARLAVYSAFGPVPACTGAAAALAPGTCRWSAPAAVALAERAGARVHPWAGGGREVPPAARLARRTKAVAEAATAGALVLLHPRSRGALLLAAESARRGLPVLALPVGCQVDALPPAAPGGSWATAGCCAGIALPGVLRWRGAQAALL